MNIKNITEPLLLTSLLLLPISFIYFNKKHYLIAISIFLNGIASYIYHLKHNNDYSNKKSDKKSNKKTDISLDKTPYLFDMITSHVSFILSVYLAQKVSKPQKYILLILTAMAFLFYGLNLYYNSYSYHLTWHIFVLLGQLFLALKIKGNKK